MKQPIVITAAHLNVFYTTDKPMGTAELYLEIGDKWVKVLCENFDPSGFHVSHIMEGHGILHLLEGTGKVSAG